MSHLKEALALIVVMFWSVATVFAVLLWAMTLPPPPGYEVVGQEIPELLDGRNPPLFKPWHPRREYIE